MTVDELLTIEEIKQLRQAYSAYFDSQAIDDLAALFCEDAVCEFPAAFGGDWVGAETIRANFADIMPALGEPFDSLHVVTNPWITITGSEAAHGRWYLTDWLTRQKAGSGEMTTLGGHENPLLFLGIYEDQYRKVGNAWKFARIRLSLLWPEREFTGLVHR
ncbi:nuclear transport factor 2 family protein [Haloactinomyces albus]|uniref:Ketosteroid isomerase-like protein n=1 Tax=Haloactinomyces albus TaxID=1352928 RepID=A0AAE4CRR6_9ACTN|nr:nuclear transport factor 2 family protein [Haloactinomyces albus]MDR7303973.1 ketosteroid isomerase-like protein [Haloactinomyces albus]